MASPWAGFLAAALPTCAVAVGFSQSCRPAPGHRRPGSFITSNFVVEALCKTDDGSETPSWLHISQCMNVDEAGELQWYESQK